METFSALLVLCAGNSTVPGEFPAQRPVTRSFDVFLDLRLNKRLSKQSWGWWFETLSRPLWRHCNDLWKIDNIDFDSHRTRALSGWVPTGYAAWLINAFYFSSTAKSGVKQNKTKVDIAEENRASLNKFQHCFCWWHTTFIGWVIDKFKF